MEVLAACHVHSEWSYDGSWSLRELGAMFQRRGYRILMITEHDRGFTTERLDQLRSACALASSETFLVLPGIEYSDASNRIHILVWGNIPFLGEGLPTGETLTAVVANGGVAVLAHPGRRGAWNLVEPQWADKLLGIEVWNRKYDGFAPSETAPALLQSGKTIPFVGLDFHTSRQLFPLAMVFDIDSEITEESVMQCLKLGCCHGKAFGLPLTSRVLRCSISGLRVVEKVRRRAALLYRSAKSLAFQSKARVWQLAPRRRK